MDRAPARPAYYPGSDSTGCRRAAAYPAGGAPRARRRSVAADRRRLRPGRNGLHTEYFAPVLAVIEIPGLGAAFLNEAIRIANDDLAGTLGVNLIAHPRTLRAAGPAFDEALAKLRYGTIAVNAWSAFGFLLARAPWGAFPGNTLADVGSGIGVVHNALLLDSPERTVVRGPFRPAHRALGAGEFTLTPKPPWFVTNRTAATTGAG